MTVQSAKCLRISAVILFGFLAVAGGVRLTSVRAQSSQTQPSPDAAPQQPATDTQASAAPAAPNTDAEMTTQETSVPLRVLVNLVPVRVVVRDANGNAVAGLHKEDFQLFQDGKPQLISNFSVVKLDASSHPVVPANAAPGQPGEAAAPAFLPPSRFVALLFDDAHLEEENIMQSRNAVEKYLAAYVKSTDRVAVFTVSGQGQTDFTDDRDKLHNALKLLQPRVVTGVAPTTGSDCPPMDYYEAEAIQNQNDSQATGIATQDALVCSTPSTTSSSTTTAAQQAAELQQAQALVIATALRKTLEGESLTEAIFRSLQGLIGRMSMLPGQRNIVFISPGFIYPNLETEYSNIVDRAIRESVFINTLDARGLYTADLNGDISQRTNDPNPAFTGIRTSWRLGGQSRQTDTLMYFASDTGGHSFHGSNDLNEGLREVAGAPDAYYFLAFAPPALKNDGHFHSLKVSLVPKQKYTIQARRGYYAPKHGETPAEAAKRDIDDALFSQEEQHGVPVGLQTQYYKTGATDAKLAVLAHLDLAHVRFTKAEGRNEDAVVVVAAIFDRNGNFVTGSQRTLTMKLRDETYQKLIHTGVTVRTSFDLKPGDYVVRLVVRDSNASALSAENGVVEIPY